MRHAIAACLLALVLIGLTGCHRGFVVGYRYSPGYHVHPAPCPPPGYRPHHHRHYCDP